MRGRTYTWVVFQSSNPELKSVLVDDCDTPAPLASVVGVSFEVAPRAARSREVPRLQSALLLLPLVELCHKPPAPLPSAESRAAEGTAPCDSNHSRRCYWTAWLSVGNPPGICWTSSLIASRSSAIVAVASSALIPASAASIFEYPPAEMAA